MRLAKDSDVMIVVGGRNSANTSRLLELCRKVGQPAHHVETERELKAEWFQNCSKVGVTAGASTPDSMVKKVVNRIGNFVHNLINFPYKETMKTGNYFLPLASDQSQ